MKSPNLRRLSRDELAYRNLLAARRGPVHFEWLEAEWTAALAMTAARRSGLLTIELDWGGARALLRADAAWIDRVAERALGVPLPTDAPEPLVTAMLEASLGDLVELIEQATHKRVRIAGVARDANNEGLHALIWHMEADGLQTQGELWLDALALGFLASAWRGVPAAGDTYESLPLDELPIVLRLALGWADIGAHRLSQLGRGDVVLLDECWLRDGTRLVLRAGRVAFHCLITAATLEITEGPNLIMSDNLENPHDEIDAESFDAESFDDLPIRLSFDLGERSVTLAELRAMGPGTTFDLGRDLRRAVHMRANGKKIGEGELLDIDGRIGVAILSLNGTQP